MAKLILKCRPRIAMWASCSSASLVKTTSSIRIKTLLFKPCFFNCSCCSSNDSTRRSSHFGKKNRSSQYCRIISSRTGLQLALPMKATIRSNLSRIRIRISEIALDFPILRPPIKAKLNGILLTSRFGSQLGNIFSFPFKIIFLMRSQTRDQSPAPGDS